MNSESVMVGIDLGTTNSVIAVVGEYPDQGVVFGPVTVLWDDFERRTHASAVCKVDGELLVGEDAKSLATEGYAPVRFAKKYMGTNERFRVGDEEWSAQQVSAEVLKHLCAIAAKALGVEVQAAVVTHPAYFDALAIDATKKAGQLAGLDMEGRLTMEPVAAAMAYTHENKKPHMRVLIYDLGGGTFDITLVERTGGNFRPIAFGGDRELGGYNFDKKIAMRMLKSLRGKGYTLNVDPNAPERDRHWASLMHHAEQLKIKLSQPGAPKADLRISGVFKDDSSPPKSVQLSFTLTQSEFLELIEPEIAKTIRETCEVLQRANVLPQGTEIIDDALKEKIQREVDFLVLVGGSCRLPAIRQRLQEAFGLEPQFDEDVLDLSVAIGAAMIAATSGTTQDGVFLKHVPTSTDRRKIGVSGRVLPSDEFPVPENFSATVTGGLAEEATAVTGKEGGFFMEVELIEDCENELDLQIDDPNGKEFFRRSFTVTHSKGTPPPPPPPKAALPKPISVDSDTGFFKVAGEGVTLPYTKSFPFFTTQELREISIDLYQEDVQLGEILLKVDTPVPSNTRGELQVSIAENYAMEVTASVPSLSISKTQKIQLEPLVIPSVEDLKHEFSSLCASYHSQLENSPAGEAKARVAAECDRIIEETEELLEDEHPERMQIYMNIKRLFLKIKQLPVAGTFTPTSAEMEARFQQARGLLPQAINKQPAIADQKLDQTLDSLQQESRRAYQAENHADWEQIGETVNQVIVQLERILQGAEMPPPPPPPPRVKQIIEQALLQLQMAVVEKERSGDLSQEQAARCQADLQQAAAKLNAVDLSQEDRAIQQLRSVYLQHVKPVADELDRLGKPGEPKRPPIRFN